MKPPTPKKLTFRALNAEPLIPGSFLLGRIWGGFLGPEKIQDEARSFYVGSVQSGPKPLPPLIGGGARYAASDIGALIRIRFWWFL